MYNHIEYPEAYARARKARILQNATTTFFRKFEDASEIISYITYDHHGNSFLKQMRDSFNDYGKLSEKQVEAIRNIRAKRAERKAEREAQRAEEIKTKGHVGEIKERRDFVLTLKFKTGFQYQPMFYGDPGYKDIIIFQDADGNEYKYTGLAIPLTLDDQEATEVKPGDQYTFKATIKAHEMYKGCPQTVLTRPAKITVVPKQKLAA